jgi:predicted deacylase
MPVHVVHGKKEGPRLFVCAAVHGDELNGVEIVRHLLALKALRRLAGTLVTLGARVSRGDVLGYISNPYSGTQHPVRAHIRGVIIGRVQIPSVHEGEALFHVARFSDDHEEIADEVEAFQQTHLDDQGAIDEPIV